MQTKILALQTRFLRQELSELDYIYITTFVGSVPELISERTGRTTRVILFCYLAWKPFSPWQTMIFPAANHLHSARDSGWNDSPAVVYVLITPLETDPITFCSWRSSITTKKKCEFHICENVSFSQMWVLQYKKMSWVGRRWHCSNLPTFIPVSQTAGFHAQDILKTNPSQVCREGFHGKEGLRTVAWCSGLLFFVSSPGIIPVSQHWWLCLRLKWNEIQYLIKKQRNYTLVRVALMTWSC